MTNQELQEIKDRWAVHHGEDSIGSTFFAIAVRDITALVAEVGRLRAIVADMETAKVHIAANPVMSKSVQKRLAAQMHDDTSEFETSPFEDRGKTTF